MKYRVMQESHRLLIFFVSVFILSPKKMCKKQCLKKEQKKNLKGWTDSGRERILSKYILQYSDSIELG